jgi:hypothetical protein
LSFLRPLALHSGKHSFLPHPSAILLHLSGMISDHTGAQMAMQRGCLVWLVALALSSWNVHAQSLQALVQQVVDTERMADQNDHSNWIYLQEISTPKEHILQWVATTQQASVQRVLEKDGQRLTEDRQRDLIQHFLHDTKAQEKQISETNHDLRQVDDLLELLPSAFVWTQTGVTATTTSLHFEPAPKFHPPTREARVFSNMTGDLVVDNQQHRICRMSGRLLHDVTFFGGMLGTLKQGGSFTVEEKEVAESHWQLTSIKVQLDGKALFFKSVSLHQDDERSKFQPGPPTVTLDQAAVRVMSLREISSVQDGVR